MKANSISPLKITLIVLCAILFIFVSAFICFKVKKAFCRRDSSHIQIRGFRFLARGSRPRSSNIEMNDLTRSENPNDLSTRGVRSARSTHPRRNVERNVEPTETSPIMPSFHEVPLNDQHVYEEVNPVYTNIKTSSLIYYNDFYNFS